MSDNLRSVARFAVRIAVVPAAGIALMLAAFSMATCSPRHGPASGPVTTISVPATTTPSWPSDSRSVFRREAVAADHPLASRAGAEMLALGGNAVDAAVATSFALSVVRPDSCGIGGGGFMVVHLQGPPATQLVIDYRERAPASASPGMFEALPDDASQWSGRAAAVPGTVAGLLHALEKYGTLDRATVLAPAIRIAREGFRLDAHAERSAETLDAFLRGRPDVAAEDAAEMRRAFIGDGGDHEARGAPKRRRVSNPGQAEVLERIARDGLGGFYAGPVAEAIVAAVNRHGGGLTRDDLSNVRPREVVPLTASWRGKTIVTMPLPSSGGVTMIQILELMERTRPVWQESHDRMMARLATPERPGHHVPPENAATSGDAYFHCLAESLKHAFADRALYLGDPAFMAANPTGRLLDSARLDAKAAQIRASSTRESGVYKDAAPLPDLLTMGGRAQDDHGTSHFSVVDRWGNAVACTETINLAFGSRVLVSGCGFMLNNQMDDFQTRRGQPNAFGLVQSDRNLPQPGKCPLSSMTPTIVIDSGGRVESVLGASGGPRIITGTVQSLLHAQNPAFGAWGVWFPRLHHQWTPDVLRIEPLGVVATSVRGRTPWPMFAAEHILPAGFTTPRDDFFWGGAVRGLQARGHAVQPMLESACVQMIHRAPSGDRWQAICDPRKGGEPAGE